MFCKKNLWEISQNPFGIICIEVRCTLYHLSLFVLTMSWPSFHYGCREAGVVMVNQLQGHHQLSGKSDENKQFQPNQIAPSIYIIIELCYFPLDQWQIKIHLLWGICFNTPHWPRSHSTNRRLQHIEELSKSIIIATLISTKPNLMTYCPWRLMVSLVVTGRWALSFWDNVTCWIKEGQRRGKDQLQEILGYFSTQPPRRPFHQGLQYDSRSLTTLN